jgi:cytidylate kinase
VLVLQSFKDSLEIVPCRFAETFVASFDGAFNFTYTDDEKYLSVTPQGFTTINEDVAVQIHQEEIAKNISLISPIQTMRSTYLSHRRVSQL